MTITYTGTVANSFGFGNFWKLLFRWRGSVYRLVWPEMIAYCIIYAIMSLIYRLVLETEQRAVFERVALECDYYSQLIPVSFVLGFYVTLVVSRWWEQYNQTPWPDSLCILLSTSIEGHDMRSCMMRRTIARYVNLSFTMTFIMVSTKAKKRFPTTKHLIEAGLLEENEMAIFHKLDNKSEHPKYWMPLVWAGTIVKRARREGRIRDDFAMRAILDEILKLRGQCGALLGYDWINVPLVYTQVVTLAVYSFFLATIMGRQFLDSGKVYNTSSYRGIDYYVPIFTFLQFFFYMGWLKVAESLLNPFGEDDDDFETNFLIDRNLQVSYLIVDEMHDEHPKLIQDKFWDEGIPNELPYTKASEDYIIDVPMGSTAEVTVSKKDSEVLSTSEPVYLNKSFKGVVSSIMDTQSAMQQVQRRRTIRKSMRDAEQQNGKATVLPSDPPAVKAQEQKVVTPTQAAPTQPVSVPKEEPKTTTIDIEKESQKPEAHSPTMPLVKEPSQESLTYIEQEEEMEREMSNW